MTNAYHFTCRPKPFERGLRVEVLTDVIRSVLRQHVTGFRPTDALANVQPKVYLPSRRDGFFRDEAVVQNPTDNDLPTKLVFVTTGHSMASSKLFSGADPSIRPALAPFVDAVRSVDPWATVGLACLPLPGSRPLEPIEYRMFDDLEALLAASVVGGQVLEARLDGTPPL